MRLLGCNFTVCESGRGRAPRYVQIRNKSPYRNKRSPLGGLRLRQKRIRQKHAHPCNVGFRILNLKVSPTFCVSGMGPVSIAFLRMIQLRAERPSLRILMIYGPFIEILRPSPRRHATLHRCGIRLLCCVNQHTFMLEEPPLILYTGGNGNGWRFSLPRKIIN